MRRQIGDEETKKFYKSKSKKHKKKREKESTNRGSVAQPMILDSNSEIPEEGTASSKKAHMKSGNLTLQSQSP